MTNPIFHHRYHLIVGFTCQSTLPDLILYDLIKIMRNFTVNQGRDIWPVMAKSLTCAKDLLSHSAVMVIFKENGTVVCREFGLHNPHPCDGGCDGGCASQTLCKPWCHSP